MMIVAIGMNRKSSTPITHTTSAARVRRVSTTAAVSLHRLERADGARGQQVNRHDHDRHYGERGRKREIVRGPDVVVDDVPDEVRVRPPDQQRRDEVAEREGKRED